LTFIDKRGKIDTNFYDGGENRMVAIRLTRMGRKNSPFYRIVIVDKRKPRETKVIDYIGYYNPLKDPSEIKVDTEKAKYWLSKGAQPTASVKAIFKKLPEFKNN